MAGSDYAQYGAAGAAVVQGALLIADLRRGKGWPWKSMGANAAVLLAMAIHVAIGSGVAWLIGISSDSPLLLACAGGAAVQVAAKMIELGASVFGKELP